MQARKLWRILSEHNEKGTYEITFGVTEPLIVKEMARYSMLHIVDGLVEDRCSN